MIVLNRRTEVIMSNNIQLENGCIELIKIAFGDEFEIMQECLNINCAEMTESLCDAVLPENITLSPYGKKQILEWVTYFNSTKNPNAIVSLYPIYCKFCHEAYHFFHNLDQQVAAKHLLSLLTATI